MQQHELSVQSAMLLLRQCAVPQLNYLLRCTPPSCVREQAEKFDQLVQQVALDKLAIFYCVLCSVSFCSVLFRAEAIRMR